MRIALGMAVIMVAVPTLAEENYAAWEPLKPVFEIGRAHV